jgi:hypothetical protein
MLDWGATGDGGAAAVAIATLSGVISLTACDFRIVSPGWPLRPSPWREKGRSLRSALLAVIEAATT